MRDIRVSAGLHPSVMFAYIMLTLDLMVLRGSVNVSHFDYVLTY